MSRRRGYQSDEDREKDLAVDDRKRSRMDDGESDKPSNVVHIRNVCDSTTEMDIAHLAIPFGKITNMIFARRKNQALIEMEDFNDAKTMVDHYRRSPPVLSGRQCHVQFSIHSRLNLRTDNVQIERAISYANSQAKRGGDTYNNYGNGSMGVLERDSRASGKISSDDTFNSVLHVMLENRTGEPINHLLLYKVFSRYGRVQRIIMFSKSGTEQALIEYESAVSALTAKVALDNRALLGGRYPMKIEFSKMTQLDVRRENEKCRDFARAPLNDMELCALDALSMVSDLVVDNSSSSTYMDYGGRSRGSPTLMSRGLSRDLDVARRVDPYESLGVNRGPQSSLSRLVAGSIRMSDSRDRLDEFSTGRSRNADREEKSVLLISNLNEEKADPDKLFTLFGVYGDVERVKVMYSKKDTALIQFRDPRQAGTARDNLNHVMLWGKPIKITFSHHDYIQMPREDIDVGLTKDYHGHKMHRYKTPNSVNYKNIFPPGPVLHLSNIPLSLNEDDIRDLFEKRDYNIQKFRFLHKEDSKRKMALVELESVEEAVLALIDLHGYELDSTSGLRVSFSSRMHDRSR